jgi:hypothetical protein
MSKSGFMIPPWPATVNRLPAHPEFPFPAVDIPACGGIIPPCGAVCVPFWNAIYKLPYARTKKNYYEYVYPLINEIRIKSKDIAMEGPGEFNK